jgi:hypothetical protein
MNNNLNEDDHKFLMQMGREVDASGLEPKRQAKTVVYNQAKVKKRNDKDRKAAQGKAETNARLAKVTLIFDKDVIEGLKGQKLQDQLDAFRLAGAPLPALKKDVKAVADKKKAIQQAIDQHEMKKWTPKVFDDEEADSFQADEFDEEDEEEEEE